MRTILSSTVRIAWVDSKAMDINAEMLGECPCIHQAAFIDLPSPRIMRIVTSTNWSVHDIIMVDCKPDLLTWKQPSL
jgi:hypothetical protein